MLQSLLLLYLKDLFLRSLGSFGIPTSVVAAAAAASSMDCPAPSSSSYPNMASSTTPPTRIPLYGFFSEQYSFQYNGNSNNYQQQRNNNCPTNQQQRFVLEQMLITFLSIFVEFIINLWNRLIQPNDNIVLYIFVGFGTVPFLGFFYTNCFYRSKLVARGNSSDYNYNNIPYHSTILYHVAECISQASRIAIIVYVVDCFIKVLIGFGLDTETLQLHNVSKVVGKILYIIWIGQQIVSLKRWFLHVVLELVQQLQKQQKRIKSPNHRRIRFGQMSIVDRLLNGIIYICTCILILDVLDVEMGLTIKSMVAFGSISTVIIGLASRDVATMLLHGLSLSVTNLIQEGDDVQFGGGSIGTTPPPTIGVVEKIGWFHTSIRYYDDLIEIVCIYPYKMFNCLFVCLCTVTNFLQI